MKLRKAQDRLMGRAQSLNVLSSDAEEYDDWTSEPSGFPADGFLSQVTRERMTAYSTILIVIVGVILGVARLVQVQANVEYLNGQIRELDDQLAMMRQDAELIPQDEELCCPKSETYAAKASRLELELKACLKTAEEESTKTEQCSKENQKCTKDLLEINMKTNAQEQRMVNADKELNEAQAKKDQLAAAAAAAAGH